MCFRQIQMAEIEHLVTEYHQIITVDGTFYFQTIDISSIFLTNGFHYSGTTFLRSYFHNFRRIRFSGYLIGIISPSRSII